MMKVGIVGHAQEKFTKETEAKAHEIIREILSSPGVTEAISGHSPMGGIDLYTEEIAKELGIKMTVYAPKQHSWDGEYGFKARNTDIAKNSDEVHVIVVKDYPPNFRGQRFKVCYHCAPRYKSEGILIPTHVKSGGDWTAWKAHDMGKICVWHIIGDTEIIEKRVEGKQ